MYRNVPYARWMWPCRLDGRHAINNLWGHLEHPIVFLRGFTCNSSKYSNFLEIWPSFRTKGNKLTDINKMGWHLRFFVTSPWKFYLFKNNTKNADLESNWQRWDTLDLDLNEDTHALVSLMKQEYLIMDLCLISYCNSKSWTQSCDVVNYLDTCIVYLCVKNKHLI